MKAMSKRNTYFERVKAFKDRFQRGPTEELETRLNSGNALVKEAAIALREVLDERASDGQPSQPFSEDRTA